MVRPGFAVARRKRMHKVRRAVKGFRGRAKNCNRISHRSADRAMAYSTRDRRKRGSVVRRRNNISVNAAVRSLGCIDSVSYHEKSMGYSRLRRNLKKSCPGISSHAIARMAIENPNALRTLSESK